MKQIKKSILDLAVVIQGGTAAEAIGRTVELAKMADHLNYERFWLAEHHNMANIASASTAILIGHVAQQTSRIRVGSGGIMLPNHAPLVVAEAFGTLETLYPKRIDLGLGRAPGTDQLTASALRRNFAGAHYDFGSHIEELQGYFNNTDPTAKVRAFPGEGADVPIWILGSSTDSAYLAAEMGLPYAFASHFAPAQFMTAINIYRKHFKPSKQLDKPYTMACVNIVAADSDQHANFLATSIYQMFLGIVSNKRGGLKPPVESMDDIWEPHEEAAIRHMLACTFIGGPATLTAKLDAFIEETGIQELMVNTAIFDQQERLHSYKLVENILPG